jgi:phenylpropionate dioxygenase-like ring-hydroxylating dioxygenase large terminal subunit
MCGITTEDEARIYYYVLWPMTFLSIHPDYLLVHHLRPEAAGRTRVVCEWLFEEATMAMDGFDPSEPIAFWDQTNREDWHVCELQQAGSRSRSWVAGRYANNESSVQAFDLMVADRYAGDGIESHAPSRESYQVLPPKGDPGHHHVGGANGHGDEAAHRKDRHGARRKARAGSAG